MLSIDRKDKEILYQLDLDSRQSNSQIARKVRLSKEVVGYRIGRMQKEGIIQGFYTLVDITKLGYLNGRIFFKFKNISPEEEREFHQYFMRHKSSWWVNSISGSFSDSGIAFWLRDNNGFHALKEEILEKYRDKIEFFRESFYARIHVWRKSYLTSKEEKKKYNLIPGNSQPVEFDAYDVKLLATLAENARIPLVELAKQTGLSVTTTKYRLQKLKQKGVILGFRPRIDLSKIGYYWYKAEFQLEDYSKKPAMLAYFNSHPNIVWAYESIGGGTDIELEAEVESYEKFRELIDALRAKFSRAIRTYVYYLWSAEYKIVFFPSEEFFEKKEK
ncbi:MAG: winged helix-turn-helix transcriptional regulator [Candidatus Anstonellaceae archaeon]